MRPKETTRDGKRPERTIYELTPAGEAEMREWMREILRTPVKEFPQFEAGLSLLPALPPEEASGIFEPKLDGFRALAYVEGAPAGWYRATEMRSKHLNR
jgi:hypothetical protein